MSRITHSAGVLLDSCAPENSLAAARNHRATTQAARSWQWIGSFLPTLVCASSPAAPVGWCWSGL